MISKTKLKELVAYKQQKRCDEEDVFVVEGVKLVDEALQEGVEAVALCATQEWCAAKAEKLQSTATFELFEVSESDLERLSSMRAPNQVWMLARRGEIRRPESAALTLVLDRIQDPGNMGTIIRIADWFGIRHIVCSKDTVSCYNPKVVQSTMGGIFRTCVEYTDIVEWLHGCGKPVYGAMLDGKNVYETQLEKPAVLVIGNESKGISEAVAACLTNRILIPNYGGTCESLNAAVATGILCAEFCRIDN